MDNEEIKPVQEISLSVEADSEIIVKRLDLENTFKLLTTVINLHSPKVVARGLNFFFRGGNLEVINANEMIHFEATIQPLTHNGITEDRFYISYELFQKVMKYLPEKVLIYKKRGVWYLRLYTGDLELINSQLLHTDLRYLVLGHTILDECVCEVNPDEIHKKLENLEKLYTFQSEIQRRFFDVCSDDTYFITPSLYAKTHLNLPEVKLYPKTVDFMVEACKGILNTSGGDLKWYKTDSNPILRYALVLNTQGIKVQIVTNFVTSKSEATVCEILNVEKTKTEIDFRDLKYNLEYITTLSSVNYFRGTVSLNTTDNGIYAEVALSNGESTKVDIPVVNGLHLNLHDIRCNASVLLSALNSLDESLNTYMYYENSYLYLFNDALTLAIVTY